ncbi:MAG TPA: hypothetical protein VGS22_01705 [Thermoanaerobaculia bacterium]|jgi:hypothetical protein|nr:hypothetical protein [Thermoanaerobaculia bacterium]
MNRPLRAALVAAIILACLPLPACGPDFSPPEFVRRREPDDPARFLAGQLGVLSPSLKTAWQVVAWRHLSGLPMPKVEAAALEPGYLDSQAVYDAMNAWSEARKAALPGAGDVSISPDRYIETPAVDDSGEAYTDTVPYLNCPADAFRTAVATLADRRARFAAENAGVSSWVQAQDAVFASCAEGEAPAVAEPESGLPAQLAADRRYQMAAASFYAGRFDDARSRFLAIGKDSASPWSGIAPYLATRSLVRQASLSSGPADRKRFEQADAELAALLADKGRAPWHGAAGRLRDWIAIRARPAERTVELAGQLAALKVDPAALGRQMIDYSYLIRHAPHAGQPDPLTEWIYILGAPSPEGAAKALERWRATHTLPWLVAALTVAPHDGRAPADLLQAAATLKDDSPGKATASFHRARLLIAAGQDAEARKELDHLLRSPLSHGSENLAQSLRLRTAASLDDLIRDGIQQRLISPGDSEEDEKEAQSARYLTGEAAFWLNTRLPLASFGAAVEKTSAEDVRERLAEAAWTRAVLLGNAAEAERAAKATAQAVPEIAAWSATAPADRAVTATWALIKNPGLAPVVEGGFPRWATVGEVDDFRRNWWCAKLPTEVSSDDKNGDLPDLPAQPPFLSAAENAAAQNEIRALEALGEGYDVIADRVLAWARDRPKDPNVPEALYLASQRARVAGCRQEKLNLSKVTFDLLKKSYPKSEWAQKAKYWY